MKTRREIEVALERAGAAMAHYLEAIHNAPDLRFAWDLAHGEWQQINHLSGTPSYEALEAENERLREALQGALVDELLPYHSKEWLAKARALTTMQPARQPPSQDAEYGELRALAEAAMADRGWPFHVNVFRKAMTPQAILAILDRNAQLAERVAVLEAASPQITINGYQLSEALEAAWPDRNDHGQGDTELTLFVRKEAGTSTEGEPMPAGLYFYWTEYPEEGVVQLDPETATPHPHADEAAKHLTDAEIQAIAEIDFYRAPDIEIMDERCRNFARAIERRLAAPPSPEEGK